MRLYNITKSKKLKKNNLLNINIPKKKKIYSQKKKAKWKILKLLKAIFVLIY